MENVLVDQDGRVKIVDFGLASMGEKQSMIMAGTPQFMSPELVHKKNFQPLKTDIWAFGILLYWMVLGYYPQDNANKKIRKDSKRSDF